MRDHNIVIDFDGTLCMSSFRSGEVVSFEEVVATIRSEIPYVMAAKILQELKKEFEIYIVTGRWEELRGISEEWLDLHGFEYDELIMMPERWESVQEWREFKLDAVDVINPIFVVDDDSGFLTQVTDMYLRKAVMITTHLVKDELAWDHRTIRNKINLSLKNRDGRARKNE